MKLLPWIMLCLPILETQGQAPQDDPLAAAKQTKEYREAYKKGAVEAEQEIKKGVVTLYSFGLGLQPDVNLLDQETGLPFEPIAGCLVSNEIFGRRDGHDEAVMAEIKRHGLPPNSFKTSEKDLFDLAGFFDRASKTARPIPLKLGGPALKSPDGKFSILPKKIDLKDGNTVIAQSFGFVIDGETLRPKSEVMLLDAAETELLWGPKGSRFAVIRCKGLDKDPATTRYLAVDLQRGTWLRWESSPKL